MIDTEGWLHKGDLGYYDRDEHFFIVDKKKILSKSEGTRWVLTFLYRPSTREQKAQAFTGLQR